MATKEEKLATLTEIYRRAVGTGKCRNQKEFAVFLGVTNTTLSSAMNGSERHLTESLVNRAKAWEAANFDGEKVRQPERPPIVIPAETQDMYNNMARAIADLTDLLRRAGISIPRTSTQKNDFRDGWK